MVQESSGLVFYGGRLITHNDSGNTAQLFEMDTTSLEITRTITILNAVNTDWEDIAQDGNYLYIGDFGNNNGNRRDLRIYRVSKSDYALNNEVTADEILFSYPDQDDFTASPNDTDWDAEALFVFQDQLMILTKQWRSQGTVAYSLPKIPGTYTATRAGQFSIGGLVTGATYNEATTMLYILGYSQTLIPFIYRVEGLEPGKLFEGSTEKQSLELGFLQAEGITEVGEDHYMFSSENFSNANPPITSAARLFSFRTADTDTDTDGDGEEPDGTDKELLIYKRFGSRELGYQVEGEILGRAIFNSSGQRILYHSAKDIEGNTMDLSALGSAVYYLTFYLRKGMVSAPFGLD
jgi:hypothetical protein